MRMKLTSWKVNRVLQEEGKLSVFIVLPDEGSVTLACKHLAVSVQNMRMLSFVKPPKLLDQWERRVSCYLSKDLALSGRSEVTSARKPSSSLHHA